MADALLVAVSLTFMLTRICKILPVNLVVRGVRAERVSMETHPTKRSDPPSRELCR